MDLPVGNRTINFDSRSELTPGELQVISSLEAITVATRLMLTIKERAIIEDLIYDGLLTPRAYHLRLHYRTKRESMLQALRVNGNEENTLTIIVSEEVQLMLIKLVKNNVIHITQYDVVRGYPYRVPVSNKPRPPLTETVIINDANQQSTSQ